jgi:hypothetical protein
MLRGDARHVLRDGVEVLRSVNGCKCDTERVIEGVTVCVEGDAYTIEALGEVRAHATNLRMKMHDCDELA